ADPPGAAGRLRVAQRPTGGSEMKGSRAPASDNPRRRPGRSRCPASALRPSAACLLLLTLCCQTAGADDETLAHLPLQEALGRLETQTPEALAAQLQVADAEAERLQARLYQNPTLNVDTNNLPIGTTTPPGLSVGQTIGTGIRIDQPLVLWG